jgi:hypothetical protein
MVQLSKKMIVLIIVVIIVVAGVAVAATKIKPATATTKKAVGVPKTVTNPTVSGWISSPDASTLGPTSATINVKTGGVQLTSVSVNITIMDDDGNHSDTDKGSDPDTVAVKIGNDSFSISTEKNSGLGSQSKQYDGDKAKAFGANLTITIQGTKFGGGNRVYLGPFGIVPVPGLVYIDQGAGYKVEVTYTYLDYGQSGEPPKK